MSADCTCTYTTRKDAKGREHEVRLQDPRCPVHGIPEEDPPPPGL